MTQVTRTQSQAVLNGFQQWRPHQLVALTLHGTGVGFAAVQAFMAWRGLEVVETLAIATERVIIHTADEIQEATTDGRQALRAAILFGTWCMRVAMVCYTINWLTTVPAVQRTLSALWGL